MMSDEIDLTKSKDELQRKKEQLDSILDAALLDLDDDSDDEIEVDKLPTSHVSPDSELNENMHSSRASESPLSKQLSKESAPLGKASVKHETKRKEESIEDFDQEKLEKELENMMQHLLGGAGSNMDMSNMDGLFSEKALGDLIHQIEKQQEQIVNQELKKSSKNKKVDEQSSSKNKDNSRSNTSTAPSTGTKGSGETDVDRTVAKLLSDMAISAGETSEPGLNMEPGQMEQMGEEIMENMMKEFEKMGQKDDADNVIDGMMKQLLSKDIMYEPMKKVMDRFPRWLAENKSHLSDEEYNR